MSLLESTRFGWAMILLLLALSVFHLLVIAGVAPREMVWGGGAGGGERTLFLEAIGILVSLGMASVAAAWIGLFAAVLPTWLLRALLWLIFAYFLMNTTANLASSSPEERAVFTPLSIVLSLLALRLAIGGRPERRGDSEV